MTHARSLFSTSRKFLVLFFTVALLTVSLPVLGQSKPIAPPLKPLIASPIAPVRLTTPLGLDDQLWGASGDRAALVAAIDHSLRYLQTKKSLEVYRKYPVKGVTHYRVQRSLKRFRQLLLTARSAPELQAAVEREFVFYQASGQDRRGKVGFTGYFEPVYAASPIPTPEYRYPLYRLPTNFAQWKKPHPTRLQLEGADALQAAKGRLKGLEIVWLRDRLEAFLVQVQGSARLELTDGKTMTVGYAGSTDYPFTGIGRELLNAGKLQAKDLTMPKVAQYFKENPKDLNVFLPKNQRFVFFKATNGSAAIGSIAVPVTAERSIATDKSLFPPGALALIQTKIPNAQLKQELITRYVLDQDTGSAIKGAGRVDYFLGTGQLAGDRAGTVGSYGELYYPLLKQ